MAAFVLLRQGRAGALKVKGRRAVRGSPHRAGARSAALPGDAVGDADRLPGGGESAWPALQPGLGAGEWTPDTCRAPGEAPWRGAPGGVRLRALSGPRLYLLDQEEK